MTTEGHGRGARGPSSGGIVLSRHSSPARWASLLFAPGIGPHYAVNGRLLPFTARFDAMDHRFDGLAGFMREMRGERG